MTLPRTIRRRAQRHRARDRQHAAEAAWAALTPEERERRTQQQQLINEMMKVFYTPEVIEQIIGRPSPCVTILGIGDRRA